MVAAARDTPTGAPQPRLPPPERVSHSLLNDRPHDAETVAQRGARTNASLGLPCPLPSHNQRKNTPFRHTTRPSLSLCYDVKRHRIGGVINSFRDDATENLWLRRKEKSLDPNIWASALRKLRMLDAAVCLADLRQPPWNRLEALIGNRAGQHSIRINDQWRICFTWGDGGADNAEITDYH